MKNMTGNNTHDYARRSITKNKRCSKIIGLLAVVSILLVASGCGGRARVGKLRTESKIVELGDAESVRVEISMGAGKLRVVGGADELLGAILTYNVAKLKPEIQYTGGKLTVRHPDVKGGASLWDLDDYRNEWFLRLNNDVPIDLSIALGAGEIDLQLAGLSLTALEVNVGAAKGTVDLTGDWARDLDATIKAGVGSAALRLPRKVGVRVQVQAGIGNVDAPGLAKDGNVYTNDAYGVSKVTLRMDIEAGVGNIYLELEQATAAAAPAASPTPTEITPEPTATIEPTWEPSPTFEEAPCPFDLPEGQTVECGFVVVPEDHNDPDGPTIRIAVAVFKDQSNEHQPDPVMLLTGGPGEKTVHNALALAQILALIHPNRDLVVFDQRGVGLSEPALECPEFVQALFDLLDEPDPDVALQTQFDALMACRDRLVSEGYNLWAYNTVQNAADVNATRLALGYDQVNLYGGSYGSLLAQATMRDYPEGIRSVAINSVLPLEKSIFVEGSTTIANAVMRLLDACTADDACDSAYPDLQEVLFEAIDQLNAEPIPITVTNPLDGQSYDAVLTGDAVLGNLVTFLYVTQIIPVLPQAIHDVHNGDYRLMTQLSSTRLALLDLITRGMTFSVLCTDDLIGRTPEDLLNVRAALPRQLVGTADPEVIVEYGVFGICENWPVQEADPRVKEPLVSDIPTLVLEGEFDPVTPPEYGQLVAENLSNSYFFEFPGAGHDIIVANECAREIAQDFLDDPTQTPNASCLAETPGVVFDLPVEAAEVVLEPFTNKELGISGVVPAGWTEVRPGLYARANTALDMAVLQVAVEPTSAKELLGDIAKGYGLAETPESTGERGANDLTWLLYAFKVQGIPRDLALAESDALTLIVLLRSALDERDALYEAVFLPAVDALVPFE